MQFASTLSTEGRFKQQKIVDGGQLTAWKCVEQKDIFSLIHPLRILPILRLIFASDFTAVDAVDGKGTEDKPRYTVWNWLMERYDGKWKIRNVIVESPLPCDNGT